MRRFISILSVLVAASVAARPQSAALPPSLSASQAQAQVDRTLANELEAARDTAHPMRYVLRKSTPRLTTTREIYETKDGDVARLMAVNEQPLSPAADQAERARLEQLAGDAGRQRHREQAEAADTARALKILRALPDAFLYQYAGPGQSPAGPAERFTFRPNPAYSAPDLEIRVLAAVSGEIWIDPAAQRAVRLEAHFERDVDFGWGILGRLNKGGSIVIEQADVGGGVWRAVRIEIKMTGRVVFKARRFDTVEEESHFAPVPIGTSYREAIAQLLGERPSGF